MIPVALALVSHILLPDEYGSITVEYARTLSGRVVVAGFLNEDDPSTEPDHLLTTFGPRNRDEGAERIAVVPGVRLDIRTGERIHVLGLLEVIEHPATFVGGVLVPPWSELRVSRP